MRTIESLLPPAQDPDGDRATTNTHFQTILAVETTYRAEATGATPQDYKYDQAEAVRAARIDGYVYVTFRGIEYGPTRVTWGALDGDQDKSTTLVNIRNASDPHAPNEWYKLWFMDANVQ